MRRRSVCLDDIIEEEEEEEEEERQKNPPTLASSHSFIYLYGTRCVPWHSWAEWGFVADAFLRLPEEDFDDDDEKKKTEKKRRAIELVQMWRTRGRVPVAVDAHAQIVELQLMDEEMKKKKMMMKKNPHDDNGEDKKETTTNSQQSEYPCGSRTR